MRCGSCAASVAASAVEVAAAALERRRRPARVAARSASVRGAARARGRRARARPPPRLAGERGGARCASSRSPSATARRLAARSSRRCWCRRVRWRATWWPGARESRASVRARSSTARRPWRSQPAARRRERGARRAQSTGTAVSAACVGVEHATAATSSSSVRSVWWPTDEITGTRSSATVRHSVSSQNANRSASEPPPRATTITSTSGHAARSCSARRTAGAAWRSCTGANAHTIRPAQPRRRRPGQDVVARLAGLAGDDADAARQPRPRQRLLRREQALGVQPPPQLLELGQQVALAGHAQPRDRERERRRGGARAGVVVAAAGDDDLRAVGERAEPQLVEVLAPHRARQRAARVAQLEPHLRPPGLEPEHLAEHLDAREAAQPVAQRGRVLADRIRAGQERAGDAVGRSPRGGTLPARPAASDRGAAGAMRARRRPAPRRRAARRAAGRRGRRRRAAAAG